MSVKNDLISVIIPVYNSEATIERCIRSLKTQTYDNYEVIFINDGSTDNSKQILETICKQEDNYSLITINNSGAGMARNHGIDQAKGNYICFVDVDDIVSPNYLTKLHEALTKTGADIACADYIRNRKGDFETLTTKNNSLSTEEAVNNLLKMDIKNGLPAKLYKKTVIGDIRMPEYAVAEDLFFNYQIFKRAKIVTINHSVIYSYIATDGSLSSAAFSKKRMGSLEAVKRIHETEDNFYSKVRLFMEAYFICELIVLSKMEEKYPTEYQEVLNILVENRKDILTDKRSTKRQKLIARLLKFGPKKTVHFMNIKRTVKRK